MRGTRKRVNYFKLGRRARRGRVSYERRWGHFVVNSKIEDPEKDNFSGTKGCENIGSEDLFENDQGLASSDVPKGPTDDVTVDGGKSGMEGERESPSLSVKQSDVSKLNPSVHGQNEVSQDRNAPVPFDVDCPAIMTCEEQDRHENTRELHPAVGESNASLSRFSNAQDVNSRYEEGVAGEDEIMGNFDMEEDNSNGILNTGFAYEPLPIQERLPACDIGGFEVCQEDERFVDEVPTSAEGDVCPSSSQLIAHDQRTGDVQIATTTSMSTGRCAWSDREIQTRFRKISRWQSVLSLLFVTGSVRVSVKHYEKFRLALNTLLDIGFPDEEKLPAYSTIERTLLPILNCWGHVRSEIRTATIDMSKAGASRQVKDGQEEASFIFVQPSAWIEMDVSCPETWNILKQASEDAEKCTATNKFEFIEETPLLRRRHAVLRTMSTFVFNPCGSRSDGESATSHGLPHQVIYSMRLRTIPPFQGDFVTLLETSVTSGREVISLTLTPIRTVLVDNVPSAATQNTSEVARTDIRNGIIPALQVPRTSLWFPGDFCTVLQVPDNLQFLLVLIHHQACPGRFEKRLELFHIPYSLIENEETCLLQWESASIVSVSSFRINGQRFDVPHRTIPYSGEPSTRAPSVGRLSNGIPYFVDHILLYSDGFSQYSFKQGSAGGIYCLSLNYPPHLRRSRGSVRALALTPPGIATTEGLRAAIPDLVKGSTTGFLTRNADGEDMIMFIDVVAYICDYHEAGVVLDVVGPNGSAPCHLCSFLRFNGPQTSASQYGNTTEVSSADGCYARTAARTKALRSSDVNDNYLVSLGLNGRKRAEDKNSPLLQYHKELKEALKNVTVPRTEENLQVLQPDFDPYRSVLVAPDHLLAGIAINELNLAFKALPNVYRRKQAEQMISVLLSSNGLLPESRIFDSGKSVLYKTSISSTFCTFLVAAPVFTELVEDLVCPQEMTIADRDFLRITISNLCLFRKLIGFTYWYPKCTVDDPRSVKAFNSCDGMKHISSLQDLCIQYITACNAICKKSSLASKELDKPNLHRLLELYMHSIPAMGHVRHFNELIFECAHQPLKRAMASSNKKNSHLQGMKRCIGDDWKNRLAATLHSNSTDDEIISSKSLLNILCGRHSSVFHRLKEQDEMVDIMTDLVSNELIRNVIGPAPVHMDRRTRSRRWLLTVPKDNPDHVSQIRGMVEDYINDEHIIVPKFFEKARRIKFWGSGESRFSSNSVPHDILEKGMAVQCLVAEEKSIFIHQFSAEYEDDESEFFLSYFAIEELFSGATESCYAAVRRCTTVGERKLFVDPKHPLQILELTDAVRRIALVHCCHSDPKLQCIGLGMSYCKCTASLLQGNLFSYCNRENGYPPRMA